MKDLATELQKIYDSEINVSISWMWDGGFDIGVGGAYGYSDLQPDHRWTVNAAAEILPALQELISEHYPDSEYAKELQEEADLDAKRKEFFRILMEKCLFPVYTASDPAAEQED